MLPYSVENWRAFFEAVGHPECIEEFSVQDPVPRARRLAPLLGQHTREVLREVGYPEDEIDRLIDQKAVATTARQPRRDDPTQA